MEKSSVELHKVKSKLLIVQSTAGPETYIQAL